MERLDYIRTEQLRGDCYKIFAALFYPPDKKILTEENACSNLSLALESACPEAAVHADDMAKALAQANAEELSVAHAKLFVGPFELLAPPYGSVYLEDNKRLMGDSTIDVMKMYQRAGLSLSEENRDAPDHIAIELEFMHYLVAEGMQSLQSGKENEALEYLRMKQSFFQRYLSPWVDEFCARIRDASEAEFYSLLAICLSVFVRNSPHAGAMPGGAGDEA